MSAITFIFYSGKFFKTQIGLAANLNNEIFDKNTLTLENVLIMSLIMASSYYKTYTWQYYVGFIKIYTLKS